MVPKVVVLKTRTRVQQQQKGFKKKEKIQNYRWYSTEIPGI